MKAEELGVIFDEADRDAIDSKEWFLTPQGYACTKVGVSAAKRTVGLHRYILGDVEDGMMIDHINRNPLDNRRRNLRVVTPSENTLNSRKRRGCSSRHKGVSKSGEMWQVVIRVHGRLKWMGKYKTEAEALAVAAPYFDTPAHEPLRYGVRGTTQAHAE